MKLNYRLYGHILPLFALICTISLITDTTYAQIDTPWYKPLLKAESEKAASRLKAKSNDKTYTYEVNYHRLNLEIDPARDTLYGAVHTRFTIKAEKTDSIVFDLHKKLTVDSVLRNDQKLPFSHSDADELTVRFHRKLTNKHRDSVTVYYHGVPTEAGFGSYSKLTHKNVPVMWTLSQPFGAKDWWPCKQTLNDKIDSLDVFVTTLDSYKVVSNGVVKSRNFSKGKVTYHWQHRYPIVPYLVAVAVTNYDVFKYYVDLPSRDSLPVVNYLYPEHYNTSRDKVKYTRKALKLFTDLVGNYPFEKEQYGHARMSQGGAMEHQTMSFMGDFSKDFITHELAHQWFGNKVTCGTWQDIWLNEGFATYFTGLSKEFIEGEHAWDQWKSTKIKTITEKSGGSVFIPSAFISEERIFNWRLSYSKGAYVIHMLRWRLGDSAFFKGLRNYLNNPGLAYKTAVTPDFKRHLEKAANQNLDEFFKDWIYGQGYPLYDIRWTNRPDNSTAIQINQSPSHPSVEFFEAKVPLKLKGDGKDTTVILNSDKNNQVHTISPSFKVEAVVFDPEQWLLAKSEVNHTPRFKDLPATVNRVQIYPNPVNKIFRLKFNGYCSEKVKFVILDNVGRVISKKHILSELGSETIVNFNARNLKSGIYFVRITCDSQKSIRKVIKVNH